MYNLFMGHTWAWHFRDILPAEGALPICWASGAYPPALDPDSTTGKAECVRKKEEWARLGKQHISPKLAEGNQGFEGHNVKKLFRIVGSV
ncbi:hypothetical protein JCM10449v2_006548 [Rhodotorula kratochvilovae]